MKEKQMIKDYTYCNTFKCSKKEKCKRWIGHYEYCILDPYTSYLLDKDCINNNYNNFELYHKFAKYLDYTTQSRCSKPEVELKFLEDCFDNN
jgi:hypothetical protein